MNATLNHVKPLIELTLKRLSERTFREDPLLGPAISRTTSVASSAQRRHGFVIEHAILCRLQQVDRFVVWADPTFAVSKVADNMINAEPQPQKFIGANVEWGDVGRTLQVDALVYDKKAKTLSAYEIKRGNDRHDSGKTRSILRDLMCVQVLLKSYGEKRGLKVKSASSRIIFYYGQCSLPKPFSLTKDELDSHFGEPIVADIEVVNDYFRKQLMKLIA